MLCGILALLVVNRLENCLMIIRKYSKHEGTNRDLVSQIL